MPAAILDAPWATRISAVYQGGIHATNHGGIQIINPGGTVWRTRQAVASG